MYPQFLLLSACPIFIIKFLLEPRLEFINPAIQLNELGAVPCVTLNDGKLSPPAGAAMVTSPLAGLI